VLQRHASPSDPRAGAGPLPQRALVAVLATTGALLLAACGSSPSSTPPTTTSTTSGSAAQTLAVTAGIKSALVAAFAAAHSLPASAYTGLAAGKTFYAYDSTTQLYWAGAQVVPSAASQRAQVSVQDDGAYAVFTRSSHGPWTAYNDGLGGQHGTVCAIRVPVAVRTVWGWSLTTPCGAPAGV
jgi:hypothetical protein